MKKLNIFVLFMLTAAISGSLVMLSNPVYGQQNVKKNAASIPENVFKIFERSCMGCHAAKGNHMAMSMLNFSKWEKQKPGKAAKKAGKICSAVTSEFMPPKKVRASKPNLVPSKSEVDEICKWAESLKAPKK